MERLQVVVTLYMYGLVSPGVRLQARACATGTATTAMAIPLFDHGRKKLKCSNKFMTSTKDMITLTILTVVNVTLAPLQRISFTISIKLSFKI